MTKFDPTKPVQTQGKFEAGIYATDGGGRYNVHGWYIDENGEKVATCWDEEGSCQDTAFDYLEYDLINIPEKPVTIERWFNIMKGGGTDGTAYATEREAQIMSEQDGSTGWIIARVSAVITFTPGEGLDDD